MSLLLLLKGSEATGGEEVGQHAVLSHLPPNNLKLNPPHHIGLMQIANGSDASFFYWLVPSSSKEKGLPLIIWFNGGPGCSGMRGLFEENGPLGVERSTSSKDGYELYERRFSWNKFAHVMYLDAPIGTGFSVEDPQQKPEWYEPEIARQLAKALTRFFVHDNAAGIPNIKNSSIYIAGESYASKFVVYLADTILYEKETYGYLAKHLKGLFWHSGLISPLTQRFGNGKKALEDGLIGPYELEQLLSIEDRCRRWDFVSGKGRSPCDDMDTFLTIASGGVSTKDVRIFGDTLANREPVTEEYIQYLQQSGVIAVQTIGGRGPSAFHMCSSYVKEAMAADRMRTAEAAFIGTILGVVPVMILHGQFDMRLGVANMQQVLNDISDLLAIFGDRFESGPRELWHIEERLVGYVKQMHLFPNIPPVYFISVRDAGHYISVDQPQVAYESARLFVTGGEFCDHDGCRVGKALCDSVLSTNCSNHGYCNPASGKCVCHPGFTGAECNSTLVHTNVTLDFFREARAFSSKEISFEPSEWVYLTVSFPRDLDKLDQVVPYIGITIAQANILFYIPSYFSFYMQADIPPTEDKNDISGSYHDILNKRIELPVDPFTYSKLVRNTTSTKNPQRLYYIGIKNDGYWRHKVTIHLETVRPKATTPPPSGKKGGKKGGNNGSSSSSDDTSSSTSSTVWKLVVIILVPTLLIWAITATIYATLMARKANLTRFERQTEEQSNREL